MIGMSNAHSGGDSSPFITENIKKAQFTAAQSIPIGSMVKVMKRDMNTNGEVFKLNELKADIAHLKIGTFSKPFDAPRWDKYKSPRRYSFALSSSSTALDGKPSQEVYTYLSFVSYKMTKELESLANSCSPAIMLQGENESMYGARAWGEPFFLDENYILIPSQYGSLATATGKDSIDYAYPGRIALFKVEDNAVGCTQINENYTNGNSITPATYANTGRPFVILLKKNITLTNKVTLPNGTFKEVDEGNFFLLKDYDFAMVYQAYDGTYKTEVRPFKVILYDKNVYSPKTSLYTEDFDFNPEQTNQASVTKLLKNTLANYDLDYDNDYVIEEGIKKYKKNEYYKNVIHQIEIIIDTEEAFEDCFYISHSCKVDESKKPDTLTEDELIYFTSAMGGKNPIIFNNIADQAQGNPKAYNFEDINDASNMANYLSFTNPSLQMPGTAGASAVPYPLYGHYCHFSDLTTGNALFLSISPSNLQEEYTICHIRLEPDGNIWTTNPVNIKADIDYSIDRLHPGEIAAQGVSALASKTYFNSSKKLPLVIERGNNYNIDNVIRTKDGLHNLVIFPYYYYDFKVNWEDFSVSLKIKTLLELGVEAPYIISDNAAYNTNLLAVAPTMTTGTPAQRKDLLFSKEWDIVTGNFRSSCCYESTNINYCKVPFLYPLSNTSYLMSYIGPLTGYPGTPLAIGSASLGIITKIIDVIEESARVYSAARTGWAFHDLSTPIAGVLLSKDVRPFSFWHYQETDESAGADETMLGEFTPEGKIVEVHNTYYASTNGKTSTAGLQQSTLPLEKGVMDLWAYPVTSTLVEAKENGYQRALFYGIAANAGSTEEPLDIYIFEDETQ